MPDPTHLFLSFLYSSIGIAYYIYGKKQQMIIPFVSGVGIFLIPYLIGSVAQLVIAGVALMSLPFFIRV